MKSSEFGSKCIEGKFKFDLSFKVLEISHPYCNYLYLVPH
jgi:hypothetical protein